jgi:tetraacyldisaccharide 4'-kinase
MANKLDFLFFFGRPFGPLYGFAMKIRQKLYTKQIFKQENPGVPVISVGNLVLGGTGKTPTVIHIAKMLQTCGMTPAIVSRGYGGSSKEPINVVSDGQEVLMTSATAGDEPVLLAHSLMGVPVLTGRKRILPSRHAVTHLGANIILLDDGFQHMGVAREVDLVLFDATELAGNSRIFPGGPLREPVAALHRSSAFLITGENDQNKKRSQAFADLLRTKFKGVPVFTSNVSTPTLTDYNENIINTKDMRDAFVFCAIANPKRVAASVTSLGINISGSLEYEDHSTYYQETITALCQKAMQAKATCLITTAKDFVKVKGLHFTLPLYVLHIKQEPEPGFDEFILEKIK